MRRLADQRRHRDAAVAEEHARQRVERLARARQILGDDRVPEEQLQQQRHVAQHLDVERRRAWLTSQLRRQPREADDGADDGRQHDAEQRDAEGVQQARRTSARR